MKTLGIYLHIPFCKSKCRYCDFCSQPNPTSERMERYVAALCRDLADRAADCADYTVDTVYFGGGTPTLLPPDRLVAILDCAAQHYRLSSHAEITAECNPSTVDYAGLRQMCEGGFNRISMGLQSANSLELKRLGRLHSYSDFEDTWNQAVRAGFSNLSADVMFGIPHQTTESFLNTLERVTSLSPKHLSAYSLTVEEGTAFGKIGEEGLQLPDEDTVREMYLMMSAYLAEHGLHRYEISNFAVRGYESRHNLKYWRGEEYLGFGPAAYSDFKGARFGNSRSIEGYLEGKDITEEREIPLPTERNGEYVMLGMRLEEGISLSELRRRAGERESDRIVRLLERYAALGLVRLWNGRAGFTSEGMLVSNTLLAELLDFRET